MSSYSLFLSTGSPLVFRRRNVSPFTTPHSIVISRRPTQFSPSLSVSLADRNLDISWFPLNPSASDDYGGWEIGEIDMPRNNQGLPPLMLVGFGTSIAALFAAIAYFSFSINGLKIRCINPTFTLRQVLMRSEPQREVQREITDNKVHTNSPMAPGVSLEIASSSDVEPIIGLKNHEQKIVRVILPVAVDAAQEEALLVLKKLKIIEDDVKAEELCTRREYARWLVRANSMLERNPKHIIHISSSVSSSEIAAFDDVSPEDPDFGPIQALAKSGMTSSKLSGSNSSFDPSGLKGLVYFFPDRFVSRQDLIDWKAQVEYEQMPWVNKKISRMSMDFMDMGNISSDAPQSLCFDMMAGDKSILRKVFGQGKRFQPNKPSTKAQAAVALTSGRMADAIQFEILRVESDSLCRKKAMEEIKSEILSKEIIKKYWDREQEVVKTLASDVKDGYLCAIHKLEEEKSECENARAGCLKEKAALDCQKQLVFRLKEEVKEMSERVEYEKGKQSDEQKVIEKSVSNLEMKLEGRVDAKSILETELEALRILRSWIEEEGKKSHGRAKVLEEACRRWKWEN